MLDVVLEVRVGNDFDIAWTAFNPCCAGCSSGRNRNQYIDKTLTLSILVVLDVVLEVFFIIKSTAYRFSFNPCCAGCSSGSETGNNPNNYVRYFQSLLCWM